MRDFAVRTLSVTAAFFFLIATLAPATAGPARRAERRRQIHQEERIRQGVRSGELTAEEARRLEEEQKAVVEAKQKARQDGVVTPQEKQQILQMQQEASKNISEEKHDAEKRPGTP